MKSFVNKPGTPSAEFNNVPFEADAIKDCRTLQHYLQALLRHEPHNVEKLITCPEGENVNEWIYACFRQFLQELNYYAYEHREVSTVATEPAMFVIVDGNRVECLSAAHNPPKQVPAIDYITQTIDQATTTILNQQVFPGGTLGESGRSYIETFCRRLYRVFLYSYGSHRDIFDRIEKKTHICERFTRFAMLYSLLAPKDIHIPQFWEEKKE